MEIVKLQTDEWRDYRELRLKALKEDPQAFGASLEDNLKYTEEEWKRRLENALNGETNWLLFARVDDRLVGMIGAYMEEGSEDTATLIAMYVPKEERGKGISRLLMESLLNELSQKPYLKKVKLNVNKIQDAAVALYKSSGFEEIGNEKYRMGDGNLADELIMEKRLQ